MRTDRVRSIAALSGVLFVLGLATACSSSSDSSTNPTVDPLIGTWHVTSYTAPIVGDVIQQGMTVTVTIAEDNSYSLAITGDQVGACTAPATSCSQSGTWSTSGNTITLTQSSTDVTSFTYAISGSTMTWTGSIDGIPVTITMAKG